MGPAPRAAFAPSGVLLSPKGWRLFVDSLSSRVEDLRRLSQDPLDQGRLLVKFSALMDGSTEEKPERTQVFPSPFYGAPGSGREEAKPDSPEPPLEPSAAGPNQPSRLPLPEEFRGMVKTLASFGKLDESQRVLLAALVLAGERKEDLGLVVPLALLSYHDAQSHWIAAEALRRLSLRWSPLSVDARLAYDKVQSRPLLTGFSRMRVAVRLLKAFSEGGY